MIKAALNSLVWYKGRPALVTALGEKITITAAAKKGTESINVREKDIEVLHPGPVTNTAILNDLANQTDKNSSGKDQNYIDQNIRETWELIESGGIPVNLKDLAELAYGEFTPQSTWAARILLDDGLYFTGNVDEISAKSAAELGAAEEKRQGKAKENSEREAFLERTKKGMFDPVVDNRFMQDVEALAFEKTDKSRTMKELGRAETPQSAHRLLLECGFWDKQFNPYPQRFGISLMEASLAFEPSSSQPYANLERQDLTHLLAFAIDNSHSNDPDDAVSLEYKNDRHILYVHVADPASEIANNSSLDMEARARGATLYLPEGRRPMLGEDILNRFILESKQKPVSSLTFKISLGSDGSIEDIDIFPSMITVTRLSYEEADKLIAKNQADPKDILNMLCSLADRNLDRRQKSGGVNIILPEVHISVVNRKVQVQPLVPYRSAEMIRECMLLAGEGAALWAARRQLPFPYITQETGDLPAKPLSGLAGTCQLRRCMRPRLVSAKPWQHMGLGLDGYCQVTSPLRRYTDLLAHQQIYAWLYKDLSGQDATVTLLSEEELLFCLAAGDAAAQAVTQAERASRLHWTAIYLDEIAGTPAGKDTLWDAVVTEKRHNGLGVIIPSLGLETQIGGSDAVLNDQIKLRLKSVRIPELEMNFVQEK